MDPMDVPKMMLQYLGIDEVTTTKYLCALETAAANNNEDEATFTEVEKILWNLPMMFMAMQDQPEGSEKWQEISEALRSAIRFVASHEK